MDPSALNKSNTKKINPNTNNLNNHEFKTDMPVSEKDEVKKAEDRMKKQMKGK